MIFDAYYYPLYCAYNFISGRERLDTSPCGSPQWSPRVCSSSHECRSGHQRQELGRKDGCIPGCMRVIVHLFIIYLFSFDFHMVTVSVGTRIYKGALQRNKHNTNVDIEVQIQNMKSVKSLHTTLHFMYPFTPTRQTNVRKHNVSCSLD